MRIKDIKSYIENFNNYSVDKHYKMEDFLRFLSNSTKDNIPTHILTNRIYLHSLILPHDELKGDYIRELLDWDLSSDGNQYGYGYGRKKFLSDPYDGSSPSFLVESEPIFFFRDIFNHTDSIIEFNQKLAHILDISWHEPKNSFCKIDENGDYFTVATIEDSKELELCTINKKDLFFYLYLSDSIMLRFFDVDIYEEEWKFDRSNEKEIKLENRENEIYANLYYKKDNNGKIIYSILRGFQIIQKDLSDEYMYKQLTGLEEKNYEDFLICDFKNNRLIKWSSNPEKIGNYFVKSDLPFETSPAYFNPEVLSKYKNDPDKYTIEPRRIDCRGIWSLRYAVNDENQVFAYIKDLSGLPYKEQTYWKSFNEKPKTGLPEYVIKSDFKGDWNYNYHNPLGTLKYVLKNFPKINYENNDLFIYEIPKLDKSKDINTINYILTDSTKEWNNQIEILHQNLIEGLKFKNIKKIAKKLNCFEGNEKLRSIKLLKECLIKINIEDDDINIIIEPLIKLNNYRRYFSSHATSEKYPDGELSENYKNLIEECDKSMNLLAKIINQDKFNF